MSYTQTVDPLQLRKWNANGFDLKAIESELRGQGCDNERLQAYLEAYRKYKLSRKQFNGCVWMGVGAFLGFISCVLSLVNPFPEWYNLILFGLTSIAILIIVTGMYLVFE